MASASAAPVPLQPVIVKLKSQPSVSGITGTRAVRLREVIRRRQAGADASFLTFRARLAAYRLAGKTGGVTRLWVVNGFALSATQEVIDTLAADPAVESVTPDAVAIIPATAPVEPNIAAINAPSLWTQGDTGQGVTVASLDSGVDVGHPDLAGTWRGGTNSWFDPYNQHPTTPTDISGHGTAVMGVVVGGSAGGTSIGVAPGARWIAARIFNDAGASTTSATHLAFQWLLDPDANPATADAPQVVNNSWSFASPGCNLTFSPDIDALRAAGIVPLFAAGNFGSLSASPANNPGAFAVGSTLASGAIASDSGRGPSTCGEPGGTSTIFPELTAPGVGIHTTDTGGFYTTQSGTSLAAPHVAGALALLLSAHPTRTVAEQESALKSSALDLGAPGPDNTFGYGRLDVTNLLGPPPPPPPDLTPPVVSSVAAAPASASGGPITLSASALSAGSTTAAAEWFDGADPGAGNGTAMTPADGAFDQATEALTATVDASALAPGTHALGVRARNAEGVWGSVVTTTVTIDRTGPAVSGAGVSPALVSTGSVALSATAVDASSATAGAEWFDGSDPGTGNGTAMAAADGAFDQFTEALTATVDASAFAPGSHTIGVRARDALGNWGAVVSTTLVIDRAGPVASGAAVTPTPTAAASVALSATATDPAPATAVAGAEWFEGADPGAGNGISMAATDGAFGATSEGVSATIATAGMAPGTHVLQLRARDAAGNWGAPAVTTLVIDRVGPALTALAVSPTPTLGAASAALSATATDPAPATAVAGAEWFEGADPGAGNGIAMAATDGAFGATSEGLAATIPTAVLAPGGHLLKVRARDAAGNWGATGSITLTVSPSPLIFADGFESGTFGAWNLVSGAVPSRIAVTAAARRDGSYGMQAVIAGNTPSYVQDTTPANESSYRASFDFNPNGTNTNATETTIFTARTGGSSPATVLSVQYRRASSPVRYQLRLLASRSGGSSTTNWLTVTNAFHTVGVVWSSAKSASVSLALDGVTSQTITKLDTSALRVETVRLGPSGGLGSGMSGTEYFDGFTSMR